MNKLQHSYQNIIGFFNFEDIYKEEVEKAKDGEHFVEIGSLWGKSTSFMGVEIKNSGKKITFDCVDFWDERGVKELKQLGDPCGYSYITHGPNIIFEKFNENMKSSRVDDIINTKRMSSIDASNLYPDNSLDFIFLDASHEYEQTKNDIKAWYPKLKNKKIFGGHDYDWDGVRKAVDEVFGPENIKVRGTSWLYTKDENYYSIIIPFRDREKHLQTILPVLQEKFKNKKYEIIISEQDDTEIFKKMALLNVAVLNSNGDTLIFHDVDYVPSENVDYFCGDENTPFFPVRQVIFLDENNNERPEEEIPGGYRYFKHDVREHYGGVFIMSRKVFNDINGFNPCYVGWGCNDLDIYARVVEHGYNWKRNKNGLFFALYHPNSEPPADDKDEIQNRIILSNRQSSLKKGIKDFTSESYVFDTEIKNVKWIKSKNIKINN